MKMLAKVLHFQKSHMCLEWPSNLLQTHSEKIQMKRQGQLFL